MVGHPEPGSLAKAAQAFNKRSERENEASPVAAIAAKTLFIVTCTASYISRDQSKVTLVKSPTSPSPPPLLKRLGRCQARWCWLHWHPWAPQWGGSLVESSKAQQQHLELGLEMHPEPAEMGKIGDTCAPPHPLQSVPKLQHSVPVEVSKQSSGAAPCRGHCSNLGVPRAPERRGERITIFGSLKGCYMEGCGSCFLSPQKIGPEPRGDFGLTLSWQ